MRIKDLGTAYRFDARELAALQLALAQRGCSCQEVEVRATAAPCDGAASLEVGHDLGCPLDPGPGAAILDRVGLPRRS